MQPADRTDRPLILRLLDTVQRVHDRAVAALAIVLMSAIVVTMATQVFFRYVLNNSIIWAEELSSYMLVLISFLLLGAAFQRGEMMNIELVTGRLGRRGRAIWLVPLSLCMIGFLSVLSYYCYQFALLNRSTTIPALDFIATSITGETQTLVLSRYWLYLMIPIGLMLLAAHILLAMVRHVLVAIGVAEPKARHRDEATQPHDPV